MKKHGWILSTVLVTVVVGVAGTGFAQYGGGGSMGGTSSGGVYTAPKGGYSSATGIAIGAGAAAGAAIAYLALHKSSIVGCVQATDGGFQMTDGKGHTYALNSEDVDLKPGEKVQLKGKKTTSQSGKMAFDVRGLGKDYGACNQ